MGTTRCNFMPVKTIRVFALDPNLHILKCLLFQNSLSAPTKKGSRLNRYFRDVAMYNSHVSALQNNQATYVARAHFGRPTGFRGL